jgi:hypothetical protein
MNSVVLFDMQRRGHFDLSRRAADRSAQLAAVRARRQASGSRAVRGGRSRLSSRADSSTPTLTRSGSD